MHQIRLARPADLPALRALFCAVFGESPAGLDLFFSRVFVPENTVVADCGGVRGMFYLLPAHLRSRGERLPAAYLYALAVDPAWRGRGIAGEILRFLDRLLPGRGYAAAVLKPAEPSLFGYYRRFGYDHVFSSRAAVFTAGDTAPARLTPVSLDHLPGGRESWHPAADPLFCWDAPMLRYASDYAALGGTRCALLEAGGHRGYALYSRGPDCLIVAEAGGDDLPALLRALCAAEGTRRASALLAPDAPGEPEPVALVKWFTAPRPTENGYFSLGLE